jgi:hypothetical protein
MSLLDSVLPHLPIGSHEWECAASKHNENFPDKEQTGTSIWQKFVQLNKVKNQLVTQHVLLRSDMLSKYSKK